MKLHFVRSGGFIGPASRVEGSVDLDQEGGSVSSGPLSYRRALSEEETSNLKKIFQDVSSLKNSSLPKTTPDAYQFDVTVQWNDGSHQSVTIQPQTTSDSSSHSYLSQWLQDETQKMWQHKVDQLRKG